MHPLGLPDSLASERRPLVMSVLNVTPDSFSDGGRYVDVDTAVAHALQQAAAGADIIDVGGESTRPGAGRIPADEELRRVLPVVEQLVGHGLVVSIDTMRAAVARAAVGAGAALVNDVSGGLADPDMRAWVASVDVPYIAMHWRGHSTDMQRLATYVDVVDEVCAELRDRLDELAAAGVDPARVVIDPGLGFAKEPGHNWALLAALPRLVAMGHPVLIGASRKRFLGELLGDPGNPRPVADRDAATDAISALAAANGAWAVRVHDVRGSRDAVAVAAAWRAAGRAEPSAAARTGPGAAAQTGPGAGAATDPGGATLADPRAHALTDPGSAAPPDPWGERP